MIDTLRTAHPSWAWSQDGDTYTGRRGLAILTVTHDVVWRAQWSLGPFATVGLHETPAQAVSRALWNAGQA